MKRSRVQNTIHVKMTIFEKHINLFNISIYLQYLRDPDGNPYSPTHFRLQLSVDGNVYVLPRDAKQENSTTSHNGAGPSSHHHHQNHHNHPHHKE